MGDNYIIFVVFVAILMGQQVVVVYTAACGISPAYKQITLEWDCFHRFSHKFIPALCSH